MVNCLVERDEVALDGCARDLNKERMRKERELSQGAAAEAHGLAGNGIQLAAPLRHVIGHVQHMLDDVCFKEEHLEYVRKVMLGSHASHT